MEELLDQRRYSSAREERAAQPAPQSATQDDVIQLRGRCAALTAELKRLQNERCVLQAWKLNQQDKDVLVHSCAVHSSAIINISFSPKTPEAKSDLRRSLQVRSNVYVSLDGGECFRKVVGPNIDSGAPSAKV